jgi:serine/threonine protein kinase
MAAACKEPSGWPLPGTGPAQALGATGSRATVYLAHDERHNRHVALEVLKPALAAVVGAERFLAEIETTAKLQHPRILPSSTQGMPTAFSST